MPRRATKIVATLGPASNTPAMLEAMITAGVNVVRLNFSHGKAQDHIDLAALVREAAVKAGREVAIMADLQGPKIRVGKFADGKVQLVPGEKFELDASRTELGDIKGVGLDYKELPRDVKAGDVLLLNDPPPPMLMPPTRPPPPPWPPPPPPWPPRARAGRESATSADIPKDKPSARRDM